MRIRDARGEWRPLPVIHFRMAVDDVLTRRMAWQNYARYDAAARSATDVWGQRVILAVIAALLAVIGVGLVWQGANIGLGFLALAGVCVWAGIRVRWALLERRERSLRALEGHWGFCPSCDYELRRLQGEDDGCVVCPECGGAWRIGDAPDCST